MQRTRLQKSGPHEAQVAELMSHETRAQKEARRARARRKQRLRHLFIGFSAVCLILAVAIGIYSLLALNYDKGMQFFAEQEYAKAAAEFARAPGYRDSAKMRALCWKYAAAAALLDVGDVQGARDALAELSADEDTVEWLQAQISQRE